MPAGFGFKMTNFCGCEAFGTGVVGPVDICRWICGVTGAFCVLFDVKICTIDENGYTHN